jgi:sporulation protein YlmC with PRC-barrel domain
MLMKHLAACVAATALMTAAAVAQTSPASPSGNQPAMSNQPAASSPSAPATGSQPSAMPSQSQGSSMSNQSSSSMSNQSSTMAQAGSSQMLTQMSADQMRGSDLMDVDVYGADNERIGEIDDVIVSRDGQIEAIVVGVGGFLGIGEKNVAIPFDQVEFMADDDMPATAANRPATGTAGGVTTPAAPTTTGSTAAGGTTATGAAAADDDFPERAKVAMTRDQLKNAPEFKFREAARATGNTGGAAGNTAPPASTTRPGNAPQ